MGKKTDNTPEQAKNTDPAFVEELTKKGAATLKAASREELAEMVNNIPADVKYNAGAIGRNSTGEYILMVQLSK